MPVRRLQSVHLLKPASNLIAYVFEAGYQSRFTVQSFVLIGNKRTPPPPPPPPTRPDACLRMQFLHRQDSYITF